MAMAAGLLTWPPSLGIRAAIINHISKILRLYISYPGNGVLSTAISIEEIAYDSAATLRRQ